MRNHRLYEVKFDRVACGWKIVTGKGTCVKRTQTRREAESIAREKARIAASNFGINTTCRIRNLDGQVSRESFYTANLY